MRERAVEVADTQQTNSHCLLGGLIGRSPLASLDEPLLCDGLAYWRGLCRGRKFPVRSAVTLSGLAPMMRNAILIRVIGEGEDYEYRFVGDAHIGVHGRSVQGARWSEVSAGNGVPARQRKCFYDEVVQTGAPLAVRGYVARRFFDVAHPEHRVFFYSRALCLPLGRHETAVDHILTFTVYDKEMPPRLHGVAAPRS